MRVRTTNDITEIESIIKRCEVCHIAMADQDNQPYVLPFNFAYYNSCIYLHSDPTGKKIDILNHNNRVCLAFSTDYRLYHQNENVACSYSMHYRSVLAYGKVEFVEDIDRKKEIMNLIMKHYTGKDDFGYNQPAIKNVKVFRIPIDNFDGRIFGYRD
ncbi:MAG: pyridoxamine 5'-phosphate oxidase family protein [Bacteroidales bacterium]|nr:pyridoxamine 5'-phosphate oxidase family protein [Bacteroidales bacterium]